MDLSTYPFHLGQRRQAQPEACASHGLWLLSWLAVLSGVFTFCLGVYLKTELLRRAEVGLRNGIRFYRDTDVLGRCFQKETIDRLQMELHCCGNDNYSDWFEVQWISNRYLDFTSKEVKDHVRSNVDGRYLLDGVPFSCCNPASPRPCLQRNLLDNNAHYNYKHQSEELNLFNRGCRQALVDYYMGLMNTIGPGVLSFIFVQVSVIVSLRYLQTAVEGSMALENPGGDSEGFLLEKCVKDTFQGVKASVLTLLKLAHINPAAEGSADQPAVDEEPEKPAAPTRESPPQ